MSNTIEMNRNDPEYQQPTKPRPNISIFNTNVVKILLVSCALLLCTFAVSFAFHEGATPHDNLPLRSLLMMEPVETHHEFLDGTQWKEEEAWQVIDTVPENELMVAPLADPVPVPEPSPIFTVHFMRHAQTLQNEYGSGLINKLKKGIVSLWHQDVELSATGRQQLKALKKYFKEPSNSLPGFDCESDSNVIVSTLGSAIVTSAFLMDALCKNTHVYNITILEMAKEITSGTASVSSLTNEAWNKHISRTDYSPDQLQASLKQGDKEEEGMRYRQYLYKRYWGIKKEFPRKPKTVQEKQVLQLIRRFANNPNTHLDPKRQASGTKEQKLEQFAEFLHHHHQGEDLYGKGVIIVGHSNWAHQAIEQYGDKSEGSSCVLPNHQVFKHQDPKKAGKHVDNTQMIRMNAYFRNKDDPNTLTFTDCTNVYTYGMPVGNSEATQISPYPEGVHEMSPPQSGLYFAGTG